MDTPAVTRKTQQLERQGLVNRRRDASDAGASLVSLTPAGRQALSRFLEVRHQWFAAVLASWPAAERREFARLVTCLTDSLLRAGPARVGGQALQNAEFPGDERHLRPVDQHLAGP